MDHFGYTIACWEHGKSYVFELNCNNEQFYSTLEDIQKLNKSTNLKHPLILYIAGYFREDFIFAGSLQPLKFNTGKFFFRDFKYSNTCFCLVEEVSSRRRRSIESKKEKHTDSPCPYWDIWSHRLSRIPLTMAYRSLTLAGSLLQYSSSPIAASHNSW